MRWGRFALMFFLFLLYPSGLLLLEAPSCSSGMFKKHVLFS